MSSFQINYIFVKIYENCHVFKRLSIKRLSINHLSANRLDVHPLNRIRRDARGSKCIRYILGCSFLFAIGCGASGPVLVPVAGRVTVDGEPVSSGRIEFFPESGRPAIGNIDSEGRYELQTYKPGDGAKLGKYRVAITSRIIPADDSPVYNSFEDEMLGNAAEPAPSQQSGTRAQQSGRKSPRITWIVPPRYSNRDSSDLVAEVGNDGEDIDFELESKP